MMMSICFSVNDHYVQHLAVAIVSILKNNPQHLFHFYILNSGISQQNQNRLLLLKNKNCQIDFIRINMKEFKKFHLAPQTHVTLESYFRFKIIPLFPKLDKILYLDCDLLVLGDLQKIYKTDLKNNWFAMVPDAYCHGEHLKVSPYYNAGVLLFNLKKCRDDKVYDLLTKTSSYKGIDLRFMDQCILNFVAKGHICTLPEYFNCQLHPNMKTRCQRIQSQIKKVLILHYTSELKPWLYDYPHPFSKYYFHYLKISPWHHEYVQIKSRQRQDRIKQWKHFLCRYERTSKTDKLKLTGITLFKREHRKTHMCKYFILGIPVWKKHIL